MIPLRILFLGDVVGEPGMAAVKRWLPDLRNRCGTPLVVANGENAAKGSGITPALVQDLKGWGVDVITTGNHVWDRKEIEGSIDRLAGVLRPANYPAGTPGRGWCVEEVRGIPVAVINLSGRVFMDPLDCPFRRADEALAEVAPRARVIIVDFHAEATSEKRAFGWYLDGRVSAVLGTHTHIPTADAQILPRGTGYMTDVGMTGVLASVIGVPADRAIERFLTGIHRRLGVAEGEPTLQGVLVTADPATGRCLGIQRVEEGACVSEGACGMVPGRGSRRGGARE